MMGYIMNIYNTLGILYREKLMTIDEIVQLYTPLGIIGVWRGLSS